MPANEPSSETDDVDTSRGRITLPNGLARATVFLPLPDAIGLPDGKVLLIGDEEFSELAGQPIEVGGYALPETDGMTPIELEVWRIESPLAMDPSMRASFEACRRSDVARHEFREPADASDTSQAFPTTSVVLGITLLVRSHDGHLSGDVVGRALEIAQRLQLAYYMTNGGPAIETLTLERLPRLVPIAISPGPPSPPGPGNLTSLVPQPFPPSMRFEWPSVIDDAKMEMVLAAMGVAPLNVTRCFFEFRNDASIQLHRYGNYRQSIVATAAAAENLIFTLLQLMLWEEGSSLEDARELLGRREGVVKLVRREFPERLKGSWSGGKGPAARWVTDVVASRNKIVHAAHAPPRGEALRALDALGEFVSLIADTLATKHVQNRYPKTVILSSFKQSLNSRARWTKRLEAMQAQESEWTVDFLGWQQDVVEALSP